MPAKLNFFKTPASVRLVSSRSVSTSTGRDLPRYADPGTTGTVGYNQQGVKVRGKEEQM
jgi:hypothetical protein